MQWRETSAQRKSKIFSEATVNAQSGLLSPNDEIDCCSRGQLLTRFPDVIREGVGRFSGWEVSLKDVAGKLHSVHTKLPYAFAAETAACRSEIDQLINAGIVEKFKGKPKHLIPWFSVEKKDSLERRVVLDFRGLNKLTARSPALPMHREGAVQNLCGMRYYAKFDFRHGFYQIPLAADLQPYFVTVFDKQPYAFTRLPMGWTNSMAFFENAVQMTISEARDQIKKSGIHVAIESYADDVCIGARTKQDLAKAVHNLLLTYRKYGWTISPKKCSYAVEELEFLGHRFTPQGVLPPEGTLQKLLSAKPPQTRTEVRSCLGVIRALLRYCRGDAKSLATLQRLCNADAATIRKYWQENPDHWKAIIKSTSRLWYNRPDAAGTSVDLYIDASRDGFGYALFSRETKQLIRLGAGGFRREKFRSSGKAELLGMERALKEVRHLIMGKRLTIFTDATVVKQASGTKDQSFLVHKHLDALNLAVGRVEHVDGVSNVVADLLSRSPWWRRELKDSKAEGSTAAAAAAKINAEWPEWYLHMEDYLRTGKCPNETTPQQRARIKHRSRFFRMRSEKMEYSADGMHWRPCCLNRNEISQWLCKAHEQSGHYGSQTTLHNLQKMIYFPDAPSHVQNWVRSCERCQHFARHDPPVAQSFNTWQQMNQCVGLDVIGPMKPDGSQRFIIAAVDLCTRFCLISASSKANAAAIIKLLERWISLFGNPDCLQTDNAPAFVGNQLSNWMSDRGINRRRIPAYRPQCNGTVERLNQEIIRRLQRLQKGGKWAVCLPQIQALLNSHPNSVTHLSAIQIAFGYQPRLHSVTPSTVVEPNSEDPSQIRHEDILRLAGQQSMHNYSTSRRDKPLYLIDLRILKWERKYYCLTISLLRRMAISWHLSGKDLLSFRDGFLLNFIILFRLHQKSPFWLIEITCVVFFLSE